MNIPLVLSLIGRKGSGKSQVVEALVRDLTQKGFRVGVIKHLARDDFEIDQPEKDTYRYRMGGALKVILSGRRRLALFANVEQETPLQELLSYFKGYYDLVLLEGYFLEEVPKIEIYQKGISDLLSSGLKNVAGCFTPDELVALLDLIEQQLIARTGNVSTLKVTDTG